MAKASGTAIVMPRLSLEGIWQKVAELDDPEGS